MEPISEAIVSDSSTHFAERTLILMTSKIMTTLNANGLPNTGNKKSLESSFNNKKLDQQERIAEKYEMVRLTSIFGGTSIY
jgi:hypothetical protein